LITANAQDVQSINEPNSQIVFKDSEDVYENEETETVNEFIKLQELNKKSDSNLKSIGYSNEDIKLIRQYKDDFNNHIISLNELSDEVLISLGYNNDQVDTIRNFNGSEDHMIKASATCSVSRSSGRFYYDSINKATNLIVNYSFKWSGAPVFRGTDLMAVSNGEQTYFHSSSYLNVSYAPLGSTGATSSKKIYAKIHDSGNTGASFSFKMIGNNGLSYAKSGSGKVYLHRQNVNLSQVGVGVKYGHSTISISPSVSFPLGGGISFSKNVQNIGPNPLICYK